jgi:hypothetical protein
MHFTAGSAGFCVLSMLWEFCFVEVSNAVENSKGFELVWCSQECSKSSYRVQNYREGPRIFLPVVLLAFN